MLLFTCGNRKKVPVFQKVAILFLIGDVVDLKNNARSRRENKEPLMTKLQRNPGCFENYFRMDERLFNIILEKVTPLICWNDTTMRQAISPEQRFDYGDILLIYYE